MQPDDLMRNWENMTSTFLRQTGISWHILANWMSMNPFCTPAAQWMQAWSRFLCKRRPLIESYPWHTPNTVVYQGCKVALRKFNHDIKGTPLLLVAPEAGHNSQIVDYGPGQSLVQCALQHYNGDIYVMDKLPAGPEHTNYSLDDCIGSVAACIDHIGEPVNIVGLCQGGWQSAIYTALFPEKIRSLTLAAAPIDFHAGNSLISQWADCLPMAFFESMVRQSGGNMPGCLIVHGFMMMNPVERFWGDDWKLFKNCHDDAFVERHHRFNRWYRLTQPLAGKMYLQVVRELFKANKLVKGELEIMGSRVDLAKIHQPVYLVAGQKDDITPPVQLFSIKKHVSSWIVEEHTVDAGHIGVFMGSAVIRNFWAGLFQKLSLNGLGRDLFSRSNQAQWRRSGVPTGRRGKAYQCHSDR
jgi:poly(3-hydroxyalkanoate) synthetase